MLTLREHKNAIKICDLVTGKNKRQDVNYIGDHDPEHRSKVDSIRALLAGHTDQSKTRLRVNDEAIQSAIALLENGTEPSEEDSAHEQREEVQGDNEETEDWVTCVRRYKGLVL